MVGSGVSRRIAKSLWSIAAVGAPPASRVNKFLSPCLIAIHLMKYFSLHNRSWLETEATYRTIRFNAWGERHDALGKQAEVFSKLTTNLEVASGAVYIIFAFCGSHECDSIRRKVAR